MALLKTLIKDRGTDVLNLLSKSEPELNKGEQKIHDFLKRYKDDEEVQFAFEIAVMEAMLVDAAYYQDEIVEKIKRHKKDAVDKHQRTIMKMLAKRAADGTLTPETYALAKELIRKDRVRVTEHTREDGTVVPEHWRKLPEGHKARGETYEQYQERMRNLGESMQATADSAMEAATSGFEQVGESASTFFDKDQILQGIATLPNAVNTVGEQVGPGMSEFFSGETWGERIVRGAEFLSKTGSKIALSAKVVSDFGPFVGMRMLHSYFRYGGYDVPIGKHGEAGMPPENASKEEVYNWAINSLRTGKGAASHGLPGTREWALAGDHMPSEGFFIGGDGKVKIHAVGRGKDHFLPFSLGHLKQMKKSEGGMMIRRRAAGGITVEDLHVGMMMGLDQVTVISNNGVFTLDIDDRAKGIRSEHMQILNRYQDLVNLHSKSKGQGGRAGFDAYDIALGAIALEFPLHLSKNRSFKNPAGDQFWDRARPETTLVDDFRNLFNNLNPFKTDDKGRTVRRGPGGVVSGGDGNQYTSGGLWKWKTNPQGKREYNQSIFPGRRADESEQDWAARVDQRTVSQAWEKLGRDDRQHQSGVTAQRGQQASRIAPAESVFYGSGSTGTGGATYTPERWATDSPQRRDNPVTVTQTRQLSDAERRKANQELEQKRAEHQRNQDIIEQYAPAGSALYDDPEEPTDDEIFAMMEEDQGLSGSTSIPPQRRRVLRDMMDDAEDWDGVDGPWGNE